MFDKLTMKLVIISFVSCKEINYEIIHNKYKNNAHIYISELDKLMFFFN